MNTFFYIIIAMIGTIFGSFFTLATYRIPRKEDITHSRSYCPNCKHRLEFYDLIPILSYIFLGAKCRYCKEPINCRYILLEILSGIVFVLLALSIGLTIYSGIGLIMEYIYLVLIVSVLSIMLGIGNKINITVVLFGFLINAIYLYFFNNNIELFYSLIYNTFVFEIFALITYLILYIFKNNSFINNILNNYLSFVIYVALLIFIFNINIVLILLVITLGIALITRLFKIKINYVMYISFLSIAWLIINNFIG
ncbi:MAG: prepilin peptidase [Clostridia bacterium]|nr:prepilin peptidase [Clostridia bacterium]